MKRVIEGLEHLLEKGGIKKDIGLVVLSAGIYCLAKEKKDPESGKIYSITAAAGGAVALVCALLLFA